MAVKKSIGASIALDGEKEYRQALKSITANQKELTSEMKLATTSYQGTSNSLEALDTTNKVLSKQIESQTEKVNIYSKAVQESTDKQKKSAEVVETLKDQLAKAQKEMEEMAKSSKTSAEAMDNQKQQVSELEGKLSTAENTYTKTTAAANSWKTSLNYASAELAGMNNNLAKNEKYLDEATHSTDKCATSIDTYGKQTKVATEQTSIFGDVLKANIASDAIISGVKKLTSELGEFVKNGIEMASDLAESQNVIDVTFGESADSIDKWAKTLATGYGISILQGKQYAGTMGAMLSSMQMTNDETLDMSTNLVELAGDMASFYNLDVSTAFEKIRSGISGETEPLKQLGINLSVANLEAYALASGITTAYASMSTKEQTILRYNYLLQTTSNAQGDFSRTSSGYANQQRIFALQMNNVATSIGQGAVPELQRGLNVLNAALDESNLNFEDLAGTITGDIVDALGWVINNLPLVESGIVGVTSATLVNKTVVPVIETINSLWIAHKIATESATASQIALNTAQAASPIGLIVTLLAGATAALVTYAITCEKATTEEAKLLDAHKEEAKTLQDGLQSIKDTEENTKAEAGTIEKLKTELIGLNEKEKLSNVEKTRMSAIVDQLNTAMPKLNLSINEQTGYLTQTTKEVDNLIDSNLEYFEVMAAQEKLTDIGKEQYDLEVELTSALEDKEKAITSLKDATEEYKESLKKSTSAEDYGPLVFQKQMEEAQTVVDGYDSTISTLQNSIKDCSNEFQDATNYVKEHTSATQENANTQINFAGTMVTVSSETAASISTLQTAYSDAKTTAEDSLKTQIGLFEELSTKSDLTTKQMGDNFDSQAKTMLQYKDDLTTAQDLIAKGFDEKLLNSIKDMGVSGAGYLHELVTSFKDDAKDFNDTMNSYNYMEYAKGELVRTVADMNTGYASGMEELIQTTQNKYGTLKTMTEEGLKTLGGAFTLSIPMLGKNTHAFAQSAIDTFEANLKIVNGKSLKFQDTGFNVAKSFADGILSGASEVHNAMNSVVQGAIDDVDVSTLTTKIDKALGAKLMSTK